MYQRKKFSRRPYFIYKTEPLPILAVASDQKVERGGVLSIHTTCHAEAGGDRRKYGDNSLQHKLPSFQFLHSIIRLIWLILKAYELYELYRLIF